MMANLDPTKGKTCYPYKTREEDDEEEESLARR